jgi:ABC-type transporter Mla subunit MlaD
MPSLNERQRNNVRMGVFVSISLLLAIGVLVALTDAVTMLRSDTETHTVRFTVQSGVENLRSGSEVRIGGVKLGEVTAVRPQLDNQHNEPFRYIDVDFKLDRRVVLFEDARILISSPLIGAESWLDIPSVGQGARAQGTLKASERIGMLTTLLGDDGAELAHKLIQDSSDFTSFLASIRDEYETNILPILNRINTTSADAQQLVESLKHDHWPQWSGSVDELLDRMLKSTDQLDSMLGEGQGLLGDGREILAENRENVRTAVSNIREGSAQWRRVAERFNNETIDRIHALLDTGQHGLDDAVAALQIIRQDYDGWSTAVSHALGRANLASQQLQLTMTEVRRSPWKVLYRPSEKELEHELLYEAARSFAVAAADLKAASTAMQRVLDTHGDRLGTDDALMERVSQHLMAPLENYETAQQRLLDVLFADR